jgi:hypothetical protein
MAKLSVHGEPVADYVRRSAAARESRKIIYRLMFTTAIKANPDLLLRDGFQKWERYPTK